MHQITIIVFREFLEISLLIGFLSSVGSHIKDFRIILSSGIMLGIVGASILAFFTDQISNSLDGVGSEIFDASIILMTVFLMCATLIWVKQQSSMSNKISLINEHSDSLYAKMTFVAVVATSIFREGAEIVLILHSFSAIAQNDAMNHLSGFMIGALCGCICGVALYIGLFQFAKRRIFQITSFFMTFIAAGLSAEAAKILASVGVLDDMGAPIWDTSWIVSDQGILGKFLKIFIGYSAKPYGVELVFYLLTIMIIITTEKLFSGKKSR